MPTGLCSQQQYHQQLMLRLGPETHMCLKPAVLLHAVGTGSRCASTTMSSALHTCMYTHCLLAGAACCSHVLHADCCVLLPTMQVHASSGSTWCSGQPQQMHCWACCCQSTSSSRGWQHMPAQAVLAAAVLLLLLVTLAVASLAA